MRLKKNGKNFTVPEISAHTITKINFDTIFLKFYSRAISYSEPLMLELSSPTSFIELKKTVLAAFKVIEDYSR